MRVGIIDLLGKEPPRNAYSRFMRANNTNVMAQVVGVWCAEEGHRVDIAYYSGPSLLAGGLPDDLDLLFISAFSQDALVAYALGNRYRARGAITVLGGPHARSYPEHARRYFDYVVGFCDRETVREILHDHAPHRPVGRYVTATRQPAHLPGLRARWPFLRPAMERARVMRAVPLLGSLGCPYTCAFCVDAVVPYQPLDFDVIRDDLAFFQELALPRSIIVWHDPNFGVRFDDYLDAIEAAVPPGRITFAAESSLSLLQEPHLRRLRRNGFAVIAPGIESWYGIGDKSRLRATHGMEKVRRVADHVNLVQSYVPYVQANLIFGLDADEGDEPFELTKAFVDLAPAVYPFFSVLSAFGRNSALNLEYQRANRVVPVPFHFLDLVQAMNVRPKHYSWTAFYDRLCGVFAYAYSVRAMARRFRRNRHLVARLEQLFRAVSSERNNKLAHHRRMRRWLDEPDVRSFFEGECAEIPQRFVRTVRRHLGPLWDWLPAGAMEHDPNAFLHSGSDDPSATAPARALAG